MPTPTFTKSGAKATSAAKLDKAVFGVDVKNHELLKLAYATYLANGRDNLAVTKTRGLVSGGGKKPWRQKGTGRARFGSSRNPIWRGGGIAFGPTGQENYTKSLNVKAKRQAIRQALSLKAAGNQVFVVDALPTSGKTADTAKFLTKIGAERNVLIAVDNLSVELERAVRNLPNVILTHAHYLNVYDVLNADAVVLAKDTLPMISKWLGSVEAVKTEKTIGSAK